MQAFHDIQVLTRAQRKKLSVSATSKDDVTADTTAASTNNATHSESKHDLTSIPSSAPTVETVEEDDSSIDPPSLPDLSVHHPSSDSDSGDDSSHTPVHVPRSASQAFAPSSQRYSFERITAHIGPL